MRLNSKIRRTGYCRLPLTERTGIVIGVAGSGSGQRIAWHAMQERARACFEPTLQIRRHPEGVAASIFFNGK